MLDVLSKHVHVRPATLTETDDEVRSTVRGTLSCIGALLAAIRECRGKLCGRLEAAIQSEAVMAVVTGDLDYLDVLSSSHWVDAVHVLAISVTGIDCDAVRYRAAGEVTVEFQWGDRDDDGGGGPATFPFVADLWSPVEQLDTFYGTEIEVDAAGWHARFGPDEDDLHAETR